MSSAKWDYTVFFTGDTSVFSPAALVGLEGTVSAALTEWGRFIEGNGILDVEIRIETTPTGRFAGGPGSVVDTGRMLDGKRIYESAAVYELRTGTDANGVAADLIIFVEPSTYFDQLWWDPTPLVGDSEIPDDLTDGLSVVLHEIGHGLGISGYWTRSVPFDAPPYLSTFDSLISITVDGRLFFNGPVAVAAYGGPVPLTATSLTQNVTHLGNTLFSDVGQLAVRDGVGIDGLLYDLMNGTVFFRGERYNIGSLDLAILADLGFNTVFTEDLPIINIRDAVMPGQGGTNNGEYIVGTAWHENISLLGGNDRVRAGSGNDVVDGGPGFDTSIYTGTRSDYTVQHHDATLVVIDLISSRDGADTLTGVEKLAFSDGSLIYDQASISIALAGTLKNDDFQPMDSATLVYLLYAAAYARTPDEGGLLFWANRVLAGDVNAEILAREFRLAPEFGQKYGSNLDDRTYTDKLYSNVLGRPSDQGGLDFWTSHLTQNFYNRDQLMAVFAVSPENIARTTPDVTNGYWVV